MNKNPTRTDQYPIKTTSFDLRALFSTVLRQKKLLLLIIAIGAFLSLLSTFFIDVNYQASSSILIESDTHSFQNLNLESLSKPFPEDMDFILTEIEVLKSRNLAEKAVKHLNLMNDPEFKTRSRQKQDILDIETSQNITGQSDKLDNSDTVTNFLKALHVTSVPGSLAVKISFTSKDPEKAAFITNSFVSEYIKQRINIKYKTQRKLIKWLAQRIDSLRDQVLHSEIEVERYRAKNNLFIEKSNPPSFEQKKNINNQDIIAKQKYSKAVKNLKAQKRTVEKTISDLSNRYGPKHPIMIKNKAELKKINNKITKQKNKYPIGKERQNKAEKITKKTTEQNTFNANAAIQLRELKREAAASRNTLENFIEKYNHIVSRNTLENSDVHIISYANIPTTPASWNKKLVLTLGILISSVVGIIFIFLKEKLYNKFRNVEDLENYFEIPCLSSLPFTHKKRNETLVESILSNPVLPITESLRNLRIGLKNQKSKTGKSPKVISFLSSLKNEGKTTIALLISALASKAGERVILIDMNLRTPMIHDALSQSNDINLVDYLTDQKDLKEVIYKDPDTGLDIIFGSAVPNNAFNLLSMDKLDALIKDLRQNYDLIVMDTPACLTTSDARLVEQLSDFSLFSVKYNATKDKIVEQGIKPFQNHENPALAFILTHVK